MLICNLTKQLDFNLYLRVIHNSSLCSFRRRVFLQPVGKVSLLATGVGGWEGGGGCNENWNTGTSYHKELVCGLHVGSGRGSLTTMVSRRKGVLLPKPFNIFIEQKGWTNVQGDKCLPGCPRLTCSGHTAFLATLLLRRRCGRQSLRIVQL